MLLGVVDLEGCFTGVSGRGELSGSGLAAGCTTMGLAGAGDLSEGVSELVAV